MPYRYVYKGPAGPVRETDPPPAILALWVQPPRPLYLFDRPNLSPLPKPQGDPAIIRQIDRTEQWQQKRERAKQRARR